MHLVELHLEAGDAAAFALTGFQFDQEGAAVVLYRAQLIEIAAVARCNDAAFAQQCRRFCGDGVSEQSDTGMGCRECDQQFGESGRRATSADYWPYVVEPCQAVAQR